MSLNSDIESALSPIAPVAFHSYTGNKTTYITYFTYNQRAGVIADDDEQTTLYGIQVDIFSKGDLEKISKDVKKALKQLGFARTSEIELFNSKIYRKSISLTAAREVE